MAHLLYGSISGDVNKQAKEYPVAASQYFRHDGINFVYLDGSGHVTLALTATNYLFGFAQVPKGRGAGTSDSYWLSSATAGADKMLIIPVDAGGLFLLPADDTVTQGMVGDACDIIAVNDGTATQVDVGTSTTDVLLIVGLGTDYNGAATDVVVKMNPAEAQKAT